MKLETKEKVAIGAVVVSGVVLGFVPTVILGGIAVYFQKPIEDFLESKNIIKAKSPTLFDNFNSIWKKK